MASKEPHPLPLTGQVTLFTSYFPPEDWMFCHGQILPIRNNEALFTLLGTTYGGNGTNNFMLPDLRSRVPVGTGQGGGMTNVSLGQQVGTEQTKITSENLPANSLNVKITGLSVKTTGATVKIPVNDLQQEDSNVIAGNYLTKSVDDIYSAASTPNRFYGSGAIPVDLGTMSVDGTAKVDVTGKSDMPFNVMQPSLGLNYIICLEGIYPPRPYSELITI